MTVKANDMASTNESPAAVEVNTIEMAVVASTLEMVVAGSALANGTSNQSQMEWAVAASEKHLATRRPGCKSIHSELPTAESTRSARPPRVDAT